MPSKHESCLLAKKPEVQHDFFTKDVVEELVSEIKENLRLKARPRKTQSRPSPYPTEKPAPPPPSTAPAPPENPYEVLQQLLDTNCLVAEAVRRLREGLYCQKKRHFLYEDEDETLIYPLSY